jgi:hypothetical protein
MRPRYGSLFILEKLSIVSGARHGGERIEDQVLEEIQLENLFANMQGDRYSSKVPLSKFTRFDLLSPSWF